MRALVGWYRLHGTGKTFQQFLNDKTAAFLKAHPMTTPGSGDAVESEGGPIGYLLNLYDLAVGGAEAIGDAIGEHAVEWLLENAIQVEPAGEQPEPPASSPVDGGVPPPMGADDGSSLDAAGGDWSLDEESGGAGGGGCFVGDTEVLLDDGRLEAIAQLAPQAVVMSRDEHTGAAAPQRIVRKWIHDPQPTVLLHLTDGDAIETTERHRFYVAEQGFVAAGKLRAGMRLQTATDDDACVESVERGTGQAIVYNLSVENFHTYFVGSARLWVHNVKEQGTHDDDDDTSTTGP
ncbi:MAG: Hint domain-containing protein [Gammaproteobacteria bacterium]